ncbi:MAG: YqjD family protein [Acidobacteriota bacterium]
MRKEHLSDALSAEMREILAHAQDLVEATAGDVDDRIRKARAELQKRLHSARDKYDDLESLIQEKAKVADAMVRDKPYQAMGGTFLAGLLLGWFMTRK